MATASGPIPPRTLLALTTGVLLAHAVVVHNTALGVSARESGSTRVFTTRVLVIRADAPPAPPPATALRRAAPRRDPPDPPSANSQFAEAGAPPPTAPDPPPAPEQAAVAPEPAASVAQASDATVLVPEPLPASVSAPVSAEPPALTKDLALVARNYAVPGSVRLKFNATGQNRNLEYQALGELVWLHDGSRYQARLELSAGLIGSRVFSSTGDITADGLAPTRFSDRYRSERAAHFERDKGLIRFSANTPQADLRPGAQDQLSIFVQLAAMLAGEPGKYPPGTTITLQTAGARGAEPWAFVVHETETLYLPGGQLNAVKLTRMPRGQYDQKVELWLAPALSYLPARLRITQTSGDFIDQQWRATVPP